jgi:hypothetical protein
MCAFQARLVALFAALVLLLPSTGSSRLQYYCQMTGRVIGAVACDNEAASRATSPVQEVQRQDCCRRLWSSSRSASLGTLKAVYDVAPAAQACTLPEPLAIDLDGAFVDFCMESTQAPLAIGPPLFVVHCSFLS